MSTESDKPDHSPDEADFVKSPILASLIQDVPQEYRAEVLRALVADLLEIQQVERYSGLIPHPSIVERYEQTLPGSADRILSMAEQRQAADISIELQVQKDSASAEISTIKGLIWNVRLGMVLVVGLALAIVLIGMRIMELGHSAEGFAVIVGAAGGIGVAYMKSLSNSRNRDSASGL